MNRIPVGQTIRFAYAFTFGEIGTVIGLVWIPTVINAVAGFLFERFYGGVIADPTGPASLPPGFGFFVLYAVLAALILAMIAVAITRQVLGLRQGPVLAHVSLGGQEVRAFGGILGLYMLFFLFAMGLAIAIVALEAAGALLVPSQPAGEAIGAAVGLAAALAGTGALFYAMVRLSFLFVPASIVDGDFGISRSWELTKGNFWRIVAVGAATALPVILFIFAINLFILGPEYLGSLAAMVRDQAHLAKYAAQQSQITAAKMPLLLGVGLVLAPVTNGLLFAPAAFAYRVLSGKSALPD